MKIKVSEATPLQLDWLVAKCEGTLELKPKRCFDCKYHEERAVRDGAEHYCHHPLVAADHWYDDEVSFSTDSATHPSCPRPYPESYSTSWAQGGPIIERENITITSPNCLFDTWWAWGLTPRRLSDVDNKEIGPTPLIAAMRCYVASKLGEEVEIPEELK